MAEMARPPKQGLDYFPKDVGFYDDYKIMDLLERHGPAGVVIYDVILTEIYRNGYYLAEPIDRISTKIVRIIGAKWVQKRLVSQVILDCGELGLFETTLLQHGVITSVGIQKRYAAVTSRNKAHKDQYWLLDEKGQPLLNAPKIRINEAETDISATETRINDAVIPQKESKENKTKENKKICSELKNSPRPVAYRLILLNGDYHAVSCEDVEKYRSLYPAVDIDQEIRKMIGWLDANPKNRKTPRGIQKFINGWLTRAQDSARPVNPREPQKPKPNGFHNFEQRDTDYNTLMMEQVHRQLKEWRAGEQEVEHE